MRILKNISVLYTCSDKGSQQDVHPIENAALAWENGIVKWVGKQEKIPRTYSDAETYDAGGKIVIPGLVDCHTHLAFGGWRADEYEMRLKGKSYLEIAKAGGGILSTVNATRETSEDELYQKALTLLKKITAQGVTTIECKSGYGLSTEDELKQLQVYKRLKDSSPAQIVSTFLGAHTFPPEYKNNRQGYIDLVINEMIPRVAEEKLAEFCDVFVEESAFTVDEARKILETGKKYGLSPKLHADQLSLGGGAELAAETGAVSADHLEQVSNRGIRMMAEKNVIGVTLPIASMYTQQPYLDCRKLVEGGVRVALATDFNPGSAPSYDLSLAMMLTCNHGCLTPSEALKAATIYAAKAIGRDTVAGSIETGKRADFVIVDAPDINFWMYHYSGRNKRDVFLVGEKS